MFTESNGSTACCQPPKTGGYPFSSTHVLLPGTLAREVMAWGEENIEDEDLFIDPADPTKGREDEPHVTLLYGIHHDHSGAVRKVLSEAHPFAIRLGKTSRFSDCPKFDVLKVEAESLDLRRLHDRLKECVPCTESFPTYKPHVTLAFVQKGRCRRLNNSKAFCGLTFVAREIVFSSFFGFQETLPLG